LGNFWMGTFRKKIRTRVHSAALGVMINLAIFAFCAFFYAVYCLVVHFNS
jgi:uncharacterized membrane protein